MRRIMEILAGAGEESSGKINITMGEERKEIRCKKRRKSSRVYLGFPTVRGYNRVTVNLIGENFYIANQKKARSKVVFYEDIFREFNRHEIEYVVAGGLAVNLHGVPRMTQDLDLQIALSEQNIKNSLSVLEGLGYEVNQPVDPRDFVDVQKRTRWKKEKNMRALTFEHPESKLRQVDLLFGLDSDYETLAKNSVLKKAADIEIPVVALEDLIAMKRDSSRKQDRADLKMLEKVKEFEENG